MGGRDWTPEEDQRLINNWPTEIDIQETRPELCAQLAGLFGKRTTSSIVNRAFKLGLRMKKNRLEWNDAILEPTELDKAWMAGLFLGDGSISIGRAKRKNSPHLHYGLRIGVHNNDMALLEPFKRFFGGTVHRKKSGCYTWYTSCGVAGHILELLTPYLRGRKGLQAKFAIQFDRHKTMQRPLTAEEIGWRDMHYQLSRSLACTNL